MSKICYISYSVAIALSALPFLTNAETNIHPTEVGQSCKIASAAAIETPEVSTQANQIAIIADKTLIERNKLADFAGNVRLVNRQQKIAADQLSFNRENNRLSAQGHIQYQNPNIHVSADNLSAGGEQNYTHMENAAYQLSKTNGHGHAEQLTIAKSGTLTLADASFTTCPQVTPDWQLKAGEIRISTKENWGEAYNAQLRFFDVPVLYIPYFTFPVTNERKSGFLYPKIGSSNRVGVDIQTPFYWNIAPNMDATITPRYMSKHGMALNNEFRYLAGQQNGQIDLEYLASDSDNNGDERYLARLQHVGTFSDNFRAYIDYTTLSDDAYLVDIGTEHYRPNDAYVYQVGELAYFGDDWQATMKLQDFEVLGNHIQSYRTVPQIEFSNQQALGFYDAQFELYSELSRFETPNMTLPEAERYHVEAGIKLPISRPAWFINSELKLLHTYFHQSRLQADSNYQQNVTRTLPKVRIHGGLNLWRPFDYWASGYTQTIEPQVQYLYIPEKDQSQIGLYDTAPLQDDYNGLFRDKRFSGLDRIAQANQLTWGVTSRILDTSNQEVMRLSLGKIIYFNNSNIAVDQSKGIAADQSALAADLFVRFNDKWQLSSDIQYSTDAKFTNKSQLSVDYRYNQDDIFQLSHRYSRDVSGAPIEQASALGSTRLNQNWQMVARLTQDLHNKRNLESYLGFQYESCCWALRFAYHRSIDTNLDATNLINQTDSKFNNGVMLQFVIKGLNAKQSSLSIEDMFNSSIFGYKRPYFLTH